MSASHCSTIERSMTLSLAHCLHKSFLCPMGRSFFILYRQIFFEPDGLTCLYTFLKNYLCGRWPYPSAHAGSFYHQRSWSTCGLQDRGRCVQQPFDNSDKCSLWMSAWWTRHERARAMECSGSLSLKTLACCDNFSTKTGRHSFIVQIKYAFPASLPSWNTVTYFNTIDQFLSTVFIRFNYFHPLFWSWPVPRYHCASAQPIMFYVNDNLTVEPI